MESFNLGAVLFALLLVLWIGYAVPRTAARRDVMGRAREAEHSRESATARELPLADLPRSRAHEVPAMSDDRMLLRPADPTRRPRFDENPGSRVETLAESAAQRRMLFGVLVALGVVAIATVVGAVASLLPWWAPVIALGVLAAYIVGLRRAELDRRARMDRAADAGLAPGTHRRAATAPALAAPQPRAAIARTASGSSAAAPAAREAEISVRTVRSSVLDVDADRAAEQVARPGEWTPRPVPRPAYALRGDVEDLATRHAVHRRSVAGISVPLESDHDDHDEALDETVRSIPEVDVDLRLDEVLARRRA